MRGDKLPLVTGSTAANDASAGLWQAEAYHPCKVPPFQLSAHMHTQNY